MDTTICAISTAVGTGAISIIRVSGKEAICIVNSVFSGVNLTKVNSHTIHYGFIVENNYKIDEVLITIMKAPKTFTTEDTVEINCHGGISTTNKILEILLNKGCKLAEPGEFTKRAFLNSRIDLLKAEAISDIINSETEKARKLAINQIAGKLSEKIDQIRKNLIQLQASIEVNIDYPEYEDIEVITYQNLMPNLNKILFDLNELIIESENGKIIKNGINVVIIGKPNVGKSSILNAFLEEDKAIVTNIPGTTRDIIEGKINLNGILLNIIDTAGLRYTTDFVEKIGVQKSIDISEKADLIIYVIDNTNTNLSADIKKINKLKNKKIIIFINKNDISSKNNYDELNKYNLVMGNTVSKNGLNELKNKIVEMFNIKYLDTKDYSYLSSARQISLTKKAKNVIENAINNLNEGISIDMVTIDIKECYETLGEIIGVVYKEDLIDELFSRFCLGK
ncbi:MAG: tRNA uridine-5-carboxymethylaminomethyl(34) synthesis GTPase MnmE [Bacilli bacterium]|nr:tRNA uridine-5-carboxymethylaminomethyl(34) synthesis GTPase MnmE [Bacilli bacterium]MDD4406610.1 tRNA uridine-5-carboxymethylaminomethyl(34) synthesis GTPase MnmE [Bacilli bacterium]